MDSLPAQCSQQCNAMLTLFSIAIFPRIQQIIVVARLFRKLKKFVAIWRRKNSLERMTAI
jgi:hypothetical protein